jgi:Raf kinase inhibitor-like YbhB/YbcL family protein
MTITSPAFAGYQTIPAQYTCEGANISPPLGFEGVPGSAKSLALIVDDPDAPMGTWTHWVVFNIPPTVQGTRSGEAPPGVEGMNSFGKAMYGGPCPPAGTHHYYFKLYALDSTIGLPRTADAQALIRAMHGHEIATAHLVGLYTK